MALWHIPLLRPDPIDSIFDDIFDWTFPPVQYQLARPYIDPTRQILRRSASQQQQVKGKDEDNFRVTLDVRHYNPDEIALKVDGNKLLVSGKHHKQSEFGYETSQFERSYPIPSDVDEKGFTSRIDDNGILEIVAPKVKPQAIQQAGQSVEEDEKKFKAVLDVRAYKPEELTVKLQGNNLLIQGEQKSENKDEKETYVHHRNFARRIWLPKNVNLDTLHTKLTKEGKLLLEADKMPAIKHEVKQLTIEKEADQGNMEE
ncbi:alpha-crystallin B chain-like [Rhopilema esculentum]|uniref:alpha-crystallin B chain-like n=1 Tax=Rhopilema esculentum TaxID=499914 RepID=UPI0031DF2F34|eukprot:gene17431-9033_t